MAKKGHTPVVILYVGDFQSRHYMSAFRDALEDAGCFSVAADTFEEALQVMRRREISLMVCYAYGDTLSKPIDAHKGILPPIIYWYMPVVDTKPQRPGVRCVDDQILPSALIKIANGMMYRRRVLSKALKTCKVGNKNDLVLKISGIIADPPELLPSYMPDFARLNKGEITFVEFRRKITELC